MRANVRFRVDGVTGDAERSSDHERVEDILARMPQSVPENAGVQFLAEAAVAPVVFGRISMEESHLILHGRVTQLWD